MKLSRLALLSLFALTSSPVWADGVVTVYSADGLHDGDNSWYQSQFAAFTKATGIKVQYVEGGSGAIVERLASSCARLSRTVIRVVLNSAHSSRSEGSLSPLLRAPF